MGVIDSWIKPTDLEQGDHVTKIFMMPFEEDACWQWQGNSIIIFVEGGAQLQVHT